MKISANFATPAGKMAPYLTGMLLLLSITALGTSIALFVSGRQMAAELPLLEEQLARYRSREVQNTARMPHDKLVALRERVRELNDLTSTAGQPLPLLLSRLEELIPGGVWLVTMQYQSREDVTKLVAEANHAELLTDFMKRLEHSGYFSHVLLTRQAKSPDYAQRTIQFEIQLRSKP